MDLSELHQQTMAAKRPRATSNASSVPPTLSTQRSFSSSRSSSSLDAVPQCIDAPELLERARLSHSTIDFNALARDCGVNGVEADSSWRWVESANRLSVFTRTLQRNVPEVLCHGRIDCASLKELAGILHSPTDQEFATNMAAIYGKSFIFGSVDHTIRTTASDASDTKSVASLHSSSETDSLGETVTVKTATFVHADLFGRQNEQWCFLERFARKPERDGFSLSMSSLMPHESTSGKLSSARVDQLHGLTVSCLVEMVNPADEDSSSSSSNNNNSQRRGRRSPGSVRVLFYAWYNGSNPIGARDLQASAKLARARLVLLAKGLTRLPELVRRRRFGMQKLADLSAFRVKNPRCTCCTKKFRMLLASKKRCYLCGYFVCDDCWSLEQMETYNGHLVGIVICTRCSFCVDACDFSNVGSRAQDRAPIRVRPDAEAEAEAEKLRALDAQRLQESEATSRSQKLIDFLETELVGGGDSGSPSKERQSAVVSVIRALLDDDGTKSSASSASSLSSCRDSSSLPKPTDKAMLIQFDRHLQSTRVPLDQCVLANDSNTRGYALEMPADPEDVPASPIPEDEEQRVTVIDSLRLRELTDVPELELLCSLAALEMQCPTGAVSIVAGTDVTVLACTESALTGGLFPRTQTCCQHTVMADQPLVLRYLAADVRFQSLLAAREMGLQFYCGFPLQTPCGAVVGTLCCYDQRPHGVSQTQYSTMRELARTASRVLVAEAQHRRAARHC